MPPRLPNQRNRKQAGKNPATLIAMIGLVILATGLFGIATMVLGPGAFAVVGLAVLLVMFIAFHYFVWGRWLSNRLPQQDADET